MVQFAQFLVYLIPLRTFHAVFEVVIDKINDVDGLIPIVISIVKKFGVFTAVIIDGEEEIDVQCDKVDGGVGNEYKQLDQRETIGVRGRCQEVDITV